MLALLLHTPAADNGPPVSCNLRAPTTGNVAGHDFDFSHLAPKNNHMQKRHLLNLYINVAQTAERAFPLTSSRPTPYHERKSSRHILRHHPTSSPTMRLRSPQASTARHFQAQG